MRDGLYGRKLAWFSGNCQALLRIWLRYQLAKQGKLCVSVFGAYIHIYIYIDYSLL
jgi:hypothetical protein